jgi:hypothetical protein
MGEKHMENNDGLNPEIETMLTNIGKDISDATIPKKYVAITRDILQYLNELSVDIGYNQSLADWLFEDSQVIHITELFGSLYLLMTMKIAIQVW